MIGFIEIVKNFKMEISINIYSYHIVFIKLLAPSTIVGYLHSKLNLITLHLVK